MSGGETPMGIDEHPRGILRSQVCFVPGRGKLRFVGMIEVELVGNVVPGSASTCHSSRQKPECEREREGKAHRTTVLRGGRAPLRCGAIPYSSRYIDMH